MAINAREIKNRLRAKSANKVRTSISVDEGILKDFQKACESFTVSEVFEEMMTDFIKSSNAPEAESSDLRDSLLSEVKAADADTLKALRTALKLHRRQKQGKAE